MFFRYLRRELMRRLRQTIVVATGLAVAIGLAIVVDSANTGVANAQSTVLKSLYGIGTDVSVTKTATFAGGPQHFQFGGDGAAGSSGTQTLSRANLRTEMGAGLVTAKQIELINKTDGVARVATSLKLRNFAFNGQVPDFVQNSNGSSGGVTIGGGNTGNQGGFPQPNPTATSGSSSSGQMGGFDGRGGSQFDINVFSVEGIEPGATAGPASNWKLSSGRLLASSDAGSQVAVLDYSYAKSITKSTGDTLKVGGKKFTIVGIVKSTSTTGNSSSNVYIPLDVAQSLSDNKGKVTNVYVTATSADQVASVTNALETALPKLTVNSSTSLASNISGSLASASSMLSSLGKWLSFAVLLTAFLIAALLTASGVNRRTREFGTLKAIGWRNSRIVKQVVGESIVNGLLGGLAGLGVGALGVFALNKYAPTLSASLTSQSPFGDHGFTPPGGGNFGGGRFGQDNAVSAVLNAQLSLHMVVLALGLALLGGIVAGLFGGLRAARLSPAEALRSVA